MSEVTTKDIENLQKSLSARIDDIPRIIFDTEIEVENGTKHKVRFRDAVQQNYYETQLLRKEIRTGEILVPIKDKDNETYFKSLKDTLSDLSNRPAKWFSKTALFSDNFSKIFRIAVEIGLAIAVIYNFIKSVK